MIQPSAWCWIGCVAVASVCVGATVLLAVRDWDGERARPVSDSDALGVLEEAVALVKAGRAEELCGDLGGGEVFCRVWLAAGDTAQRTPKEPPTVRGSRPIDGGLVLEIEGVDALGDVYSSDFYVLRADDGKLVTPYPVYWINLKVGTGSRQRSAAGEVVK